MVLLRLHASHQADVKTVGIEVEWGVQLPGRVPGLQIDSIRNVVDPLAWYAKPRLDQIDDGLCIDGDGICTSVRKRLNQSLRQVGRDQAVAFGRNEAGPIRAAKRRQRERAPEGGSHEKRVHDVGIDRSDLAAQSAKKLELELRGFRDE